MASDPTSWARELKFPEMGLTTDVEQRLRAHLLRSFGESPDRWNFWILAFDAIAEELLQAGVLTESLLCGEILIIVRDAGIECGLDPDRRGRPTIELARRLKQRINYWAGRLELEKAPRTGGSDATVDAGDGAKGKSRNFGDEKHKRCALLFERVLAKRKVSSESKTATLEAWVTENGLNRTQVTDYLAGRIKGRIGPERRREIETAIMASAKKLGIRAK